MPFRLCPPNNTIKVNGMMTGCDNIKENIHGYTHEFRVNVTNTETNATISTLIVLDGYGSLRSKYGKYR